MQPTYLQALNRQIGVNIRRARHHSQQGFMSQAAVAEILQITSQQFAKYETGENRCSAGALYVISNVLGCSYEDLFEGCADILSLHEEKEAL